MAELIDQPVELGGSPYALPNPRTPLVGRDAELAALVARIGDPAVSMVTVTGPGGVGKTRLALQAAREVREDFRDGVVFVSLADDTGLEWFVRRVAQSLRLPGLETSFSEQALIDALTDRHQLLVLDNLEQIPEAGAFLSRLVGASPNLRLLITSRVAMHLRGEVELTLAPLTLPSADSRRAPSLEELAGNPAVALFVERAGAVDPSFELTKENAATIGRICARLDGLPLAIELAAARLKLLTPTALLARLDSRLRLLGGGARDLPDRQQNLRQTIAWSYDLLEAPERGAFRALSVFAGGFTIVAAASVLGLEEEDPELLDTLGSLVDQSLLRRTGSTEGEPRVAMLETIREFGIEQLKASGEEEALRSAHADFYRRLVERNADRTSGMALLTSTDELEDEMPNIHQALTWYIDREEADGAVGIVLAMSSFWMKRGYLVEGSRLLERAIEFVDRVSPEMQVRMLRLSGWFMCVGGNTDEALVRVKRAVEMSESLENMEERVAAINSLGVTHYYRKEMDEAWAAFVRAMEVSPPGTSNRVGALNNLGVVARLAGDYLGARKYLEQSIEERIAWGHPDPEAVTNLNLAEISLKLGDLPRARSLLAEWFSEPWRLNNLDLAANGVWGLAHLALVEGEPSLAAQLLGWSDDQRRGLPHIDHDEEPSDRQIREELETMFGTDEYERLLNQGVELKRDIVVAHARKLTEGPTPPARLAASTRSARVGLDPLTAREIEVARLVAAGRSTREIADALFISARTAQTHVTNILGKLDLESRAALAAWVVRNDPDAI